MSSTSRILVVDDDAMVAHVVIAALSCNYEHVVVAHSGDEALAVLERESFALMVTDLRMPGVDGLELTRRARQRYPNMRVIVMSGHFVEESDEQIAATGAGVLRKPFDATTLLDLVAKTLDEST